MVIPFMFLLKDNLYNYSEWTRLATSGHYYSNLCIYELYMLSNIYIIVLGLTGCVHVYGDIVQSVRIYILN